MNGPATAHVPRAAVAVASGAVVAAYFGTLTHAYAWLDDVTLLWTPRLFLAQGASQGRPVYGALVASSFAWAETVEGLSWLRACGLLGIALLAAYLVRVLWRAGASAPQATFLAITALLLPPFQTYAGWAVAWPYPWACLLSTWGGMRWLEARSPRVRGVGLASLVLAMLVYQPAACFVWAVAGFRLTMRPDDDHVRKGIGRLLAVSIAAAVVAVALARLGTLVFDLPWSSRAAFIASAADLGAKLFWLATRPLVLAVRPFLIDRPTPLEVLFTAVPACVVIAWDWSVRLRRSSSRRMLTGLMLLVIPLMAMLPNVVVRGNQIDFRVLPGVCVVGWWYLCVSLSHLAERFGLSDRQGSRVRRTIALAQVAFIVGTAAIAYGHIADTMIRPASTRQAYIRVRLGDFDSRRHTRLVVVNDPDWWGRRQSIGVFSLRSDLAIGAIAAQQVLVDARDAGIDVEEVDVQTRAPASPPPDALVIDLSVLR